MPGSSQRRSKDERGIRQRSTAHRDRFRDVDFHVAKVA
ncbi:MAG: hypothetical protein JWM11_6498, partial [Planctomycetaceae bacterium]|nr:hypothetical protein [Planctomycetaceae bacterium]